MGKQKKSSKSKSASKRSRPFFLQGAFGQAKVEDKAFGSSRTCFRSAISRLKDADFEIADNFSSSDDEASASNSSAVVGSLPVASFDSAGNGLVGCSTGNASSPADPVLMTRLPFPPAVVKVLPEPASAGSASAGIAADVVLHPATSADDMLISFASADLGEMACVSHPLAEFSGDGDSAIPSPKASLVSVLPMLLTSDASAPLYPLDNKQLAATAPHYPLVPSPPSLLCNADAANLSDASAAPMGSDVPFMSSDGILPTPATAPHYPLVPFPPSLLCNADAATLSDASAAPMGSDVPYMISDGILPTPAHAAAAVYPLVIGQPPSKGPPNMPVTSKGNPKGISNLNSVSPSCRVAAHPLLPDSPIKFGDFPCPSVLSHPAPAQNTHATSSVGSSLFHHKVLPLKEHEILSIPSHISQQGVIAWSSSLVGFFVGGKKSIHFATFWANKIWGSRVAKVFFKGNGLYIFNFKNEDDMLQILNSGPIFFGKSLMILQRWQPGKDLMKADLSSIPIWINFHNVPLALWHTDGFAFLASHFGKPLYLDDLTLKGNKLAFARVCVEIAATTSVPSALRIQIENCAPHEIRVEIPWQPNKCLHCKTFGHSTSSCPSLPRQQVNRPKRKSIWKEVEIIKEDNPPSSPHTPAPAPLGSSQGKENSSPDSNIQRHSNASQNIQKSAPESSARKRVHFDRVELLLDKVNLAKRDALSTISIPNLKSCLKLSQSGRFPTRLTDFQPP